MARKVKGLKLLVVDYFGLIRTEERAKNRYEAMTEVSGQLKALARKLKVPLLCLAQINRENAQRQDKPRSPTCGTPGHWSRMRTA